MTLLPLLLLKNPRKLLIDRCVGIDAIIFSPSHAFQAGAGFPPCSRHDPSSPPALSSETAPVKDSRFVSEHAFESLPGAKSKGADKCLNFVIPRRLQPLRWRCRQFVPLGARC